jgi:hypothetical protein
MLAEWSSADSSSDFEVAGDSSDDGNDKPSSPPNKVQKVE